MNMDAIMIEKMFGPLINKWIQPKFLKLAKTLETRGKIIYYDIYKTQFEKYFQKKYEKFFCIDTIVFQNTPKPFHLLYEPLTLQKANPLLETITEKTEFKIDKYRSDLIQKYIRIAICDSAGMGKSTLLKKIFLSVIEENIGVPVLVELRKLNQKHSIKKEILGQLTSFSNDIDEDFIIELFKRGDFIFLFDGLDEIPLKAKDIVISDMQNFIELAPNNYYIIATRPEKSIASFGSFELFTINSLTKDEAYSILKKYDAFNYKSIISELINVLEKEENRCVEEFLKTPLLVTLLYRAYDYKRKISLNKAQFYRQVYDALYEK